MTKEAKLGLLVGLMVIVGIAVLLRSIHQDTEAKQDEIQNVARTGQGDAHRKANDQAVEQAVRKLSRSSETMQQLSGDADNQPTETRRVGGITVYRRPTLPGASRTTQSPRAAIPPTTQQTSPVAVAAPTSSTPSSTASTSASQTNTSSANNSRMIRYTRPLPSTVKPEPNPTPKTTLNATTTETRGMARPLPRAVDTAVAEAIDASQAINPSDEPTVSRVNAGQTKPVTTSVDHSTAATASRSAASSLPMKKHVVRSGDNLTKLAADYYGSRSEALVEFIYQANRDVLSSKNALRIGQTLNIPPFEKVDGEKSVTRTVAAAAAIRSQKPAAHKTYVVKEGDSLWKIAQRELGDGSRYGHLQRINADILKNRPLRPGMTIRLSTDDSSPASPLAATASLSPSSTAQRVYVVKEGDSLWKIAQKELGDGNRFADIAQLNAATLSDERSIYPGMKLIIPKR